MLYLVDFIDQQLGVKGTAPVIFSSVGIGEALTLALPRISESVKSLIADGLIEKKRYYVPETGRFRDFYLLLPKGIQKATELQEKIGEEKIKVREKDEAKEMKISALLDYLKKIAKKPIEQGYSYIIKGEKTDKAYDVFKGLIKEGYKGIVISEAFPQKIREEYKIKEDIYWLSEVEGEKVLRPDRLYFELMKTISNFLKESKKPVIILEGFEYLSEINGFNTCMRWIKAVNDAVAKNNGVLILPINPAVFDEKELTLLLQSMGIYELEERVPVEINYTNIIKNITPEGLLDVRTMLEPKKYVDYSDRTPEVKYFVGREEELKELKDFMSSMSRILCIKGIAGIGKTTLLSKFLEGVKMNIFWHRFYEFSTLKNLFTKLAEFLSKMNRNKLTNYLDGGRIEVEEILIILEDELRGSNSLFVFDDVQKASKELVDFFSSFKDMESDVKTILLGREIPHFYDRRDVVIKKNVREMTLDGLDRESSKKLLRYRKIEKDLDRLYELTRGHPLMLELVTPETSAIARDYINEEIVKKLNNTEKKCLELASVCRMPFPARAIMVEEVSYDVVDSLADASLLQRSGEVYDLHDFLREFLYDRLTESQKMRYHSTIGEYYFKEKTDLARIEGIYHFIKAKYQERGAKIAIENGTNLINKGYLGEFMSVLEQFDKKSIGAEDWANILTFKGKILTLFAKWDEALSHYITCLDFISKYNLRGSMITKLKTSIYDDIGKIYCEKGNYKMALEYHLMNLTLVKRLGDEWKTAKAYHSLGDVCYRKGELDKALRFYDKCLAISKKLRDEQEIGIVNRDYGIIYRLKKEWDKSIEHFKASIRSMEELKMPYELAKSYYEYGLTCLNMGEREEASNYLKRAMEIFEKLGAIAAVEKVERAIKII
ncbi:MAG: DUF835 domain-containing protein [Candidatus Thermoplasmatota archaeon]